MIDWLSAPRSDYRRVTIPTIWVALALSLLVHIAVLLVWLPRVHLLSVDRPERDNASGPLVVQLASQPSQEAIIPPAAPPVPALQAQPLPTLRKAPAKPTPRPSSAPPVVALSPPRAVLSSPAPSVMAAPTSTIAVPPVAPPVAAPAPELASPPPPSVAPAAPAVASPPAPTSAAAPASPPVQGDLSSYIEARRRARGETAAAPRDVPPQNRASSAPRIEDDTERSNRIIAANLGLGQTPTVGYDPKGGGGIFEIQRVGYDTAEFIFYGWNKDIRRNSRQLIEVAKGDNGDIRIAVVRKMIAIIREEESGDFLWVSQRLGRNVTLSARPSDNAELEAFMMQEFFSGPRRPN